MIKYFILLLSIFLSGTLVASNIKPLADSEGLGLNDGQTRTITKGDGTNPEEKISNLGDGVYIRQFNDFGQPTVEVHPESGPSYYYNEDQIREPTAADGVMDRQTPTWMIKEW